MHFCSFQQKEDVEEVTEPPIKKRTVRPETPKASTSRNSPIQRALASSGIGGSPISSAEIRTVAVPLSHILASPGDFTSKESDNERALLVRRTMDSLISIALGRPTDLEIRSLAKSICSQYSVLRDRPEEGVRDNYVIYQIPIVRH